MQPCLYMAGTAVIRGNRENKLPLNSHSVKATLRGGIQEAVRGATGGITRSTDQMCRGGQEASQLINARLSMIDCTDSGASQFK